MPKRKSTKKTSTDDDFFLNLEELENPRVKDEQADEREEDEDKIFDDETPDEDNIDNESDDNTNGNRLLPNIEDESSLVDSDEDDWIDDEGELTIDVYQDNANIYITAPLPGVDVNDVDVSIDNDMVTIRAKRNWEQTTNEDDYFYRENYWGTVSRSIILPVAIKEEKVDAALKNGVLTVTLPKARGGRGGVNIRVKQEDEE